MDGETCMRTSPLNTPLLLVALLCLWVGPVFVSVYLCLCLVLCLWLFLWLSLC